ncbi:MAG: radical SAM family heme chaperone HemW [Clostridiales bacterium]|nr:radical SAM family heme chaperone HemW [Clostridiales bacterium]
MVSVYIHIPFCLAKCHYCDFLSFPGGQHQFRKDYLVLLEKELSLRGRELSVAGHHVGTLYIGGGTPTVLHEAELGGLLDACRRHLPLEDPEWTVEANPGTLDREKVDILASSGVNRLSLGVQDLDDRRLAILGRPHTAADAKRAFTLARDHIPSVSVDIMSGLPEQTVDSFLNTLATVIGWGPDHVSVYSLNVEEETVFAAQYGAGMLHLPGEEEVLRMLLSGKEVLTQHGFEQYEIANFAQPGKASRHNSTYWHNRPYIGLGLGSHSYWMDKRIVNSSDPVIYRNLLIAGQLPITEVISVSRRQEMEDTMMLGLRLLAGVHFKDFSCRFGEDLRDVFSVEISRLHQAGLIISDNTGIRLSERGFPVANLVFAEFITV